MKKFEYCLIRTFLDTEDLNELGGNGWELVSHCFDTSIGHDNMFSNPDRYIFKRELKLK